MQTNEKNAGSVLWTVIDFFSLLLVVGFPRIPGTNVPFAVLLIVFFIKRIVLFHLSYQRLSLFFYMLFSLFFLIGTLVAVERADFIFFFSQSVKILMSFYSGIVVAQLVSRSSSILYYWLATQTIVALSSIVSHSVYSVLLVFISQDSAGTFSNIYGIRALGFGIYHAGGAVLFVSMATLPFALEMGKKKIAFLSPKSIVSFFAILSSITMSRSALVPLVIFSLIRLSVKQLIITGVFVVTLGYLSTIITDEYGVLYNALEPIRNVVVENKFETHSTNANLRMFLLPYDGSGYFYGEGRFFNNSGGFSSGFYRHTDLGWIRLLLFGGMPICVLFIGLNVFWLVPIRRFHNQKLNIYALFLLGTFFIMNFKGLFVSIFIITLLFTYMANKSLKIR